MSKSYQQNRTVSTFFARSKCGLVIMYKKVINNSRIAYFCLAHFCEERGGIGAFAYSGKRSVLYGAFAFGYNSAVRAVNKVGVHVFSVAYAHVIIATLVIQKPHYNFARKYAVVCK